MDKQDEYEEYNYKEYGGKGGKNREKGAAGAGQGKIASKGDASKGAASNIMAAEEKRKAENK